MSVVRLALVSTMSIQSIATASTVTLSAIAPLVAAAIGMPSSFIGTYVCFIYIGAAFAGCLAATSTSGPGLSLKSEAIGLTTMAELPLVVIDVMRGGPSTGMPTKTEQTDLLQAIYGRNGESPIVVIAASSPADCFEFTYMASKIALEHMTPVILLSDTFLANGSSLWKLPKLADMPAITPHMVPAELKGTYNVAKRDENTKIRYWAIPGMEGFEHRNMGLERDNQTGSISTQPANHAIMTENRAQKIKNIIEVIPDVTVEGCADDAELLIVGWGSTKGHLMSAMTNLNAQGHKIALAHFNYIAPLPKNTADVLHKYPKVVVCELNTGQFHRVCFLCKIVNDKDVNRK